ncbi:MAG: ThuA domain-containing protein [Verrucomicrobia bacterium]|nr:ThuA domain-containing protein [Verrucomicrobiota bacterium]
MPSSLRPPRRLADPSLPCLDATHVVSFLTRSVARWPLACFAAATILLSAFRAASAENAGTPPLRVLFLTGGGYHDYQKLAPHLTRELARRVRVDFDVRFGLDSLKDPGFAKAFDAVVYDVCDDEVSDGILTNALNTVRAGKPAVMIHCAVHAFRRSPLIHEWETCCGMRSKVHDPFAPLSTVKLDPASPITRSFPEDWKSPGDELYQTISIDPMSHALLRAKSLKDGREHIVAWTYEFGRGRVFATTLGHDMKTAVSEHYLQLLANGLLWSCGKLTPEGTPAAGLVVSPSR